MSTVRDYRDLLAWQRAMDLLVVAYAIAGELPTPDGLGLAAQVRRAAGSVPANIAEGNGRASRREYARYLGIANGSLREVETYVEAGRRLGLIDATRADSAATIAMETGMLVTKLRAALLRSR